MAKFIEAENIPADAKALVWYLDENGETQVIFKKTARAAKMAYNKITDSRNFGWMTIEEAEHGSGIMVW